MTSALFLLVSACVHDLSTDESLNVDCSNKKFIVFSGQQLAGGDAEQDSDVCLCFICGESLKPRTWEHHEMPAAV